MIDIDGLKRAILLTQQGKFQEAESIYTKLLETGSDDGVLLSAVGLFYVNLGKYDRAVEYLEKACSITKTLGTVSALGFAEYERKNYKRAAEVLESSLEYGENPDIYNKLITSLFEVREYQKAIEYSQKMVDLYPEDSRSIVNQVKSLTQSGKMIEAEKLCVKYLSQHPDEASLWYSLGYLKELIYSDDRQALECYKAASDLGSPIADYNIGVSYQKLGDYKNAEVHYKKMLDKYPNELETKISLGMCYLKQKKFKEGYDLFYLRDSARISAMTNNPWKPNSKIDDEIIIICDQGFGDNVQFIRYLPFIKSSKISVACKETLIGLFQNNYPNIKFITYDEINPNIQSIRITDLAYALNMDFDNIPYSEGYLKSETADIKNSKLKVGLCWEAGSAAIRTMIHRTIHVKCFEPFFDLENVQIYSFQYNDTFKGNEKYPQMINLTKDFKNFEDTTKAIMAMDVIVTVDTVIAHLAGALGKKTFLLLPYVTDWRWFDDNKTTPWYKSIEIFKQTDPISWEQPLTEVINRLKSNEL